MDDFGGILLHTQKFDIETFWTFSKPKINYILFLNNSLANFINRWGETDSPQINRSIYMVRSFQQRYWEYTMEKMMYSQY